MRCKPGDLAIVVGSSCSENFGVIVEVIRPAFPGDLLMGGSMRYEPKIDGPHWWVRSTGRMLVVRGNRSGDRRQVPESPCPDSRLRPIRPNDGDDETLTWAGKPEKAEA